MIVSAVILAAGLSQRMGSVNKLGLEVSGKCVVRHCVDVLLQSKLQDVHVVYGFEHRDLRAMLDGADVQFHFNPDYREGQMTSVHVGLSNVGVDTDAVMVCLADQVLLGSDDVNQLIAAFEASDQRHILVPTVDGARGNPLIIPRHLVDQIARGKKNLGCKNLLSNQPTLMLAYPMSNDHCTVDIDTPEDYLRVRARFESQRHDVAES